MPLVRGDGEVGRRARGVGLGERGDDADLAEVEEDLRLHVQGGSLVEPALWSLFAVAQVALLASAPPRLAMGDDTLVGYWT